MNKIIFACSYAEISDLNRIQMNINHFSQEKIHILFVIKVDTAGLCVIHILKTILAVSVMASEEDKVPINDCDFLNTCDSLFTMYEVIFEVAAKTWNNNN